MQTFFKHELRSRYRSKKALADADEKQWRAVCQLVTRRDGRRCRACGRRTNPEGLTLLDRGHHHHVVFRSAGGADVSSNVCLLCARCHDEVHRYGLRVEGNADEVLTVTRWNLETGKVIETWDSVVGRRVQVPETRA